MAKKKASSGPGIGVLQFKTRIWRNLTREKAEAKVVEIMQDANYVTHKFLVQGVGKYTVIGVFRRE